MMQTTRYASLGGIQAWKLAVLLCTLAAVLAVAAPGSNVRQLLGSSSHPAGAAIQGLVSVDAGLAGQATSHSAPAHLPLSVGGASRMLLAAAANAAGGADGSNDTEMIRLPWLQEPKEGWEHWIPPSDYRSGDWEDDSNTGTGGGGLLPIGSIAGGKTRKADRQTAKQQMVLDQVTAHLQALDLGFGAMPLEDPIDEQDELQGFTKGVQNQGPSTLDGQEVSRQRSLVEVPGGQEEKQVQATSQPIKQPAQAAAEAIDTATAASTKPTQVPSPKPAAAQAAMRLPLSPKPKPSPKQPALSPKPPAPPQRKASPAVRPSSPPMAPRPPSQTRLPAPKPPTRTAPPRPQPRPPAAASTDAAEVVAAAAVTAPKRLAIVPPAFSSVYAPIAFPRSPSPLLAGCLSSGNVRRYGAKGDGKTNDFAALVKANAAKGSQWLWFPVGKYYLKKSLILTKPVVMGANTRFVLARGVTLTLTRQPKRAPIKGDPMFAGSGTVFMGSEVREVYPAWWQGDAVRTAGKSDSGALQAAVNSCRRGCTVLLSRDLELDRPVAMAVHTGISSTAKAILWGKGGGEGGGIVLPAGTYTRPLSFTGIRAFSKFGIKVQPGVRNADIQSGHISVNGNGIVLESGGEMGMSLYNVTVSHVSVMQSNQNSVVFNSLGSKKSLFSGVTVRVNFLLSGGFQAPTRPSAGVLFWGNSPVLSRTQAIFQAVEPAQFSKKTLFVGVATATKTPVPNFVMRSECWNGGYELPGAMVTGAFVNSVFSIFYTAEADDVGRAFALGGGSSGIRLTKGIIGEVASASQAFPVDPQGDMKAFNGGQPLEHQGYYLSLTTGSDWKPGEVRTFFTHTYFADATVTASEMPCVPFRALNPGLSCLSIAKNPTPNNRYRVAIKLVNLSTKIVPAGYFFRFGIQFGP